MALQSFLYTAFLLLSMVLFELSLTIGDFYSFFHKEEDRQNILISKPDSEPPAISSHTKTVYMDME